MSDYVAEIMQRAVIYENQQTVIREFILAFGMLEANIKPMDSASIKMSMEWEGGKPKAHKANIDYKLVSGEGRTHQTVSVFEIMKSATDFVNVPQLESAYTSITIHASLDVHGVMELSGEMNYTSGLSELLRK